VQRHLHLHFFLRLVHREVCDQKMRGLWVLMVVFLVQGLAPNVDVVEKSAKPWFDATKSGELSDVRPSPSLAPSHRPIP
jgi:hypothetical protein